ncbi:hypothetical protein LZ554_007381 [Drepanopeziza brunnea f. sp. 'monogermtubi']|nr:hypothetical protein LZ554_007381 [Drepanopeziza brunnea f. sp. 'monogermtubi']
MARPSLCPEADGDLLRSERWTRSAGTREENIMKDSVAAEGNAPVGPEAGRNESMLLERREAAPQQPLGTAANSSEQDEVVHHTSALGDRKLALGTSFETAEMDFNFEEVNGIWISAHPIGHESTSSLATTITVASILVDDQASHLASSAASMISTEASIRSASTTVSSDIYGWEEELDRKTFIEGTGTCDEEAARRSSIGGGTLETPSRGEVHDHQKGRSAWKKNCLLHKVWNLSGSRGERRSCTSDAGNSTLISPTNYEYPTFAI